MTILETTNFGFTAVKGEPPSTNDWATTYWNWIFADQLLYVAAVSHKHDGAGIVSIPTGTLSLTTAASGGALPANTKYYFAVTYVDDLNRETAQSSVVDITTATGISTPATPTINDDATPTDIQPVALGLAGGNYWYKISYEKDGGETLPSLPVYVAIPTGDLYECTIHFASLNTVANGATAIKVYRKIETTGSYYLMKTITNTAQDSYTDDNTDSPACDKQPRTVSTINSSCTVTIDWSTLDYVNAEKIRIYATTTSGTYPTNSLVAEVTMNDATPVTEYVWTGAARTVGKPPTISQSYPSPSKINLATEVQGQLSLSNLPADLSWKIAVESFVNLPPNPTEGDVRLVMDEDALYVWDTDAATPSWVKASGGGMKIYEEVDTPDVELGEMYSQYSEYWGQYMPKIHEGEFYELDVVVAGSIGYFGQYYGAIADISYANPSPGGGTGSIIFSLADKKFYYFDGDSATPSWVMV